MILSNSYGNCFTFNANKTKKISTSGVTENFFLVLDSQFDEYFPFYQTSVGFRLSIHNAETYPFPESKGFNVPPGHLTYVGLRKIHTILKEKPYSKCELLSRLEMEDRDAYVGKLPYVQYSESSCMKTCYQIELIRLLFLIDKNFKIVIFI